MIVRFNYRVEYTKDAVLQRQILERLRRKRINVLMFPTDNHLDHRFSGRPRFMTLQGSQIEKGYYEPFIIYSTRDHKYGALWKTTRGGRRNPNSKRPRWKLMPANQCQDLGYFTPDGEISIRGV